VGMATVLLVIACVQSIVLVLDITILIMWYTVTYEYI
jgi:hypothetical protein